MRKKSNQTLQLLVKGSNCVLCILSGATSMAYRIKPFLVFDLHEAFGFNREIEERRRHNPINYNQYDQCILKYLKISRLIQSNLDLVSF
jgi:hypothetical protein